MQATIISVFFKIISGISQSQYVKYLEMEHRNNCLFTVTIFNLQKNNTTTIKKLAAKINKSWEVNTS